LSFYYILKSDIGLLPSHNIYIRTSLWPEHEKLSLYITPTK
jgi:hypothetical protein